jgi:hypothetical protein
LQESENNSDFYQVRVLSAISAITAITAIHTYTHFNDGSGKEEKKIKIIEVASKKRSL